MDITHLFNLIHYVWEFRICLVDRKSTVRNRSAYIAISRIAKLKQRKLNHCNSLDFYFFLMLHEIWTRLNQKHRLHITASCRQQVCNLKSRHCCTQEFFRAENENKQNQAVHRFALFSTCSATSGVNRRRQRGGVGAGAHRVLPVSGLRVWRCPAGVCPAPRPGPALAPGTTPALGSGYLQGDDGGLADPRCALARFWKRPDGNVALHSLCSMALKIWYSSTRLSSSSTDVV